MYDVAVGPDDRLYVSSPSGIWRLDGPPTGTVSIAPSARPSRSYPWWGWLALSAGVALAVALFLRLRAERATRSSGV